MLNERSGQRSDLMAVAIAHESKHLCGNAEPSTTEQALRVVDSVASPAGRSVDSCTDALPLDGEQP